MTFAFNIGKWRAIVQVFSAVPDTVRGGPKRERWASNGWLVGFRRHYVIITPRFRYE